MAAIDVCRERATDATNISQAVREIKRVAADSREGSTSYNNDIYPASGTLIMTMFLLGSRPVGGEGDGVQLTINSEKDGTDNDTHTPHAHSNTGHLKQKLGALRIKSALESPNGY